ncbi:hypothetical protein PCANB_002969 [Pneumocystis canis]|nr:hypothetical protein PCK1_003145 [Pneumocystis canis]KAG5438118.1 hypothetical protein PCANB_002969 [Pneumocystis canis]
MFALNKLKSKLLKPGKNYILKEKINCNTVNETILEDNETSIITFSNEMNPEISMRKYKTSIANKKNIFILTLETLININIPLNKSNSLFKKSI